MNVYDSLKIVSILQECGYRVVDVPEKACLFVLNTCHVRKKATEKVFSDLGRLRLLKTGHLAPKIIVTGCVAQALGVEVQRRAPWVDIVIGPQALHKIPLLLEDLEQKRPCLCLEGSAAEKFKKSFHAPLPEGRVTAFLAIQEGCDYFCSYCVVPHTRGREFSRPIESILEEAHAFIQQGVKEITLIGQNVNAYCGMDATGAMCDFGTLLRRVAPLPGILRVRYTTSHPRHINESLLHAHATLPQLAPFIHLPAQAGSDPILKAMNRPYTRADYLMAIDKLRTVRPDIAFSSDFIVGFPGETEEDFQETLSLVKSVTYAQAYAFKYSPRPGTPAASLPDQVPESAKEERLARLLDILRKQQQDFNRQSVGKVVSVLFEKPGRHSGEITGRTLHFQSVIIKAPQSVIGSCLPVRIIELLPYSLRGEYTPSTA